MQSEMKFLIGAVFLSVIVMAGAIIFTDDNKPPSPLSISPSASIHIGSEEIQNLSITEVLPSPTPTVVTVPDFSLEKLGGGQVTLSDYRGQKPVILDFFASWCPNCQRSMPRLSGWYDQYKDDVEVIGVNLREDTTTVESFVSRYGISFPIAMDPDSIAASSYGVQYTNYHVLINRDGSLHDLVIGDISEDDVLGLIRAN